MKKIIIPLIVVILGAVCAVALVHTEEITPIGSITENPEKFRNTEVTILGEVTERVTYQNDVVFKVADESGTIAIHTQGDAPALESRVVVKGVVKSVVKIGPYEFGTIIEASKVRSSYPWEKAP